MTRTYLPGRLALLIALLCGILLGPLVWAILPLNQSATAQEQPAFDVLLIASVQTVRPGEQVSVSLTGRTTSISVRSVTLMLVLHGAGRFTSASTPSGTCTTTDTTVSCLVSISDEAPASVTAQILAASSGSGTLTVDATAQGGSDTASAETVTVQIQGDPIPSSTATPTATVTATRAAATAAATTGATSTPVVSTATTGATETPEPSATPMPPGFGPDRCEPNDTLVQPCALQSDTDIADLSFVDGTGDVYSFLLKAGRTYTIRAASTSGIDPVLTVYLAGALQTPLASNDDAAAGDTAAVVQVTTATESWYIVEVTNKAPGDMKGKTYTLSAGSSAPVSGDGSATSATRAVAATPTPTTLGDALENNFSTDTAVRLAWGVPYDLSLVCPQPHACVSGDHDFFYIPVKSGIRLVAVTYDLGPGADTFATLYSPDPSQQDAQVGPLGWRPLVANDDTAPGWTLRSQLDVTPNWDGYALLVIAPSDRSDPPSIPDASGPIGRYRLIVGSPDMAAVQTVLSAQTDGPPITPSAVPTDIPAPPTGQPAAPAAPIAAPTSQTDNREVVKEASATGMAVVIVQDTGLYSAVPPTDKDLLALYGEGAQVRLLGQAYAGYVKVQPSDAVAPGWMFAPALRPLQDPNTPGPDGTPGTNDDGNPGSGTGSGSTSTAPGDSGSSSGSSTSGSALEQTQTAATRSTASGLLQQLPPLTVQPLPPAPLPTEVQAAPEARSLTVEICTATDEDLRTCDTPIANVTVEIVLVANQSVVATARTDRDGHVTLSVSVPANAQLQVRVAALGVNVPISANATRLPIRMPPQTTSGDAS